MRADDAGIGRPPRFPRIRRNDKDQVSVKSQHTTQIILPGGQVIELIYVSDNPGAECVSVDIHLDGAATAVATVEDRPLHCCPRCEGELVYPIWWEETDDERWTVERRCPDCEWRHVGQFDQDIVDQFDDALTEGTEATLRVLREMAHTNMSEDVELLAEAIATGLIQPIDF